MGDRHRTVAVLGHGGFLGEELGVERDVAGDAVEVLPQACQM
jgi:hypothetical protein